MDCVYRRLDLGLIECLLEWKRRTAERLEGKLDKQEIMQARRDPHSRRRPLPCGLTIHPAYGCSYGCLYCYIYSMGLGKKPEPNPLSPEQLLLSLSLNEYFVPGTGGTLLAFGSITEPFINRDISEKTLSYMGIIDEIYGNPLQVSTKSTLIADYAGKLSSLGQRVSVLFSIPTLRHHRILEQGAPDPMERLWAMSVLSSKGVSSYLFLRPLIPGLSDGEIEMILAEAHRHGAWGVVPGSLRVNNVIVSEMRRAGLDVSKVLERTRGRLGRRQVPVDTAYLKKRVRMTAARLGLRVFPSSCSANMDAHGQPCWKCRYGPCGPVEKLVQTGSEDIREILQYYGLKPVDVRVTTREIEIGLKARPGRKGEVMLHWIGEVSRRAVKIRRH